MYKVSLAFRHSFVQWDAVISGSNNMWIHNSYVLTLMKRYLSVRDTRYPLATTDHSQSLVVRSQSVYDSDDVLTYSLHHVYLH